MRKEQLADVEECVDRCDNIFLRQVLATVDITMLLCSAIYQSVLSASQRRQFGPDR